MEKGKLASRIYLAEDQKDIDNKSNPYTTILRRISQLEACINSAPSSPQKPEMYPLIGGKPSSLAALGWQGRLRRRSR